MRGGTITNISRHCLVDSVSIRIIAVLLREYATAAECLGMAFEG